MLWPLLELRAGSRFRSPSHFESLRYHRQHPVRTAPWSLRWRVATEQVSVGFVHLDELSEIIDSEACEGAVAGVVGIEGGVVSGVFNLESSGVRASDWRPRHDNGYHAA